MLSDLKPVHWPAMQKVPEDGTPQGAIKALAAVRELVVQYRRDSDNCDPSLGGDWHVHHAQTAPIIDVIAGLIADAKVIDDLHEAADADAERLAKENRRLQEELAEAKRPYTAQMTMLNRRIIDLNEKLLAMEMKLAENGHEID